MKRRLFTPALLALALSTPTAPAQDYRPDHIGFSPGRKAASANYEADALAVPTPEKARAWLRTLTEEPHVAGTPADKRTADFVAARLREWGWETSLVEYEVLLNYPKGAPSLKLLRPTAKALSLTEAANNDDKDSASPEAFPAFHGYGVSGTAAGQVVYANYGRPEDFDALTKLGVDVRGKIVLVRYGELFRGLKVRNAQKRGARGVLIFSDPLDDGFARGDIYPKGPFRPPTAVQRGSVQFLSLGPGDPSTPNGPSTKGAMRLPIDLKNGFTLDREKPANGGGLSIEQWEQETGFKREDYFATIPSLPISYEAAQPILEALGGPNVPTGWQGGLPLAYHVGPGPAEIEMAIEMEYALKTIWNVIAKLKGNEEPDRWVLMGNHRDAWVYGAVDPSSGTAATLEACRALGEAARAGWKPRRTLVYASWDAEEYGLVGSTEWVDDNRNELDSKAALLLNVDSAVSGTEIDIDGVPSLRDLLLDAMGAVKDVRSGKSIRDLWVEKRRSAWASASPLVLADPLWNSEPPFTPQLAPLGSGSDYTAFLDHLGIPAVDVGFSGRYGVYHSIFDNVYWMEKFCDPEYLTHATAARLYTAILMRAAGADVLPLTFTPYGEALREYIDDLRRIAERRARGNAPGGKPAFAFTDLKTLVDATRRFQTEAVKLDEATRALAARNDVPAETLEKTNAAIQKVERAFLLPAGLPGRPWFKHAVYAPGLTTGYASWPLPGVRQALLDADATLLGQQLPRLVERINAASDALVKAREAAIAR